MQEKMSQPIKSLFWNKWVWNFDTIASAFYAKNAFIFLSLHVKSLELRENYGHSILSKNIWIRLQKCFNFLKELKQYIKFVPETSYHLRKYFLATGKSLWTTGSSTNSFSEVILSENVLGIYYLPDIFFLCTQWWQHLTLEAAFCAQIFWSLSFLE